MTDATLFAIGFGIMFLFLAGAYVVLRQGFLQDQESARSSEQAAAESGRAFG